MRKLGGFDALTPEAVLAAVEGAFGYTLNGTVVPYPSYINRVYGLKAEGGEDLVAKFYRPGRWSEEALRDEHGFLLECAEAELPVVAPLVDEDGETLAELSVTAAGAEHSYHFAVFPKRGGRNFDPETDEDWLRLGSVVGRLHLVGSRREARARLVCRPDTMTSSFVDELLSEGLVHPEQRDAFRDLSVDILGLLAPRFQDLEIIRLHGDCHRGNILDRGAEGLLLIDFDDMLMGPPMQDLWLLLPAHADESRRELALLLEGYERFRPLDLRGLRLVEGLRFMRLIYFLAWRGRQRHDHWFRKDFPDHFGKAFWIKEMEDLREQAERVRAGLGLV